MTKDKFSAEAVIELARVRQPVRSLFRPYQLGLLVSHRAFDISDTSHYFSSSFANRPHGTGEFAL